MLWHRQRRHTHTMAMHVGPGGATQLITTQLQLQRCRTVNAQLII
jgi:hypothetical protein